MIAGARQGIPAAGDIKACHLRDPAVAVCREVVVEVVEAAADAAEDNRPETTQPILIGGNNHDATDQYGKKKSLVETLWGDSHDHHVYCFGGVGPISGADRETANIHFS
jgi:hypothetical protein